MAGKVLVDGRFIPAEMLYAIEYPEAVERQRGSTRETPELPPLDMLEMFDIGELRGSKPSLEQLYRDAIGS